MLNIIDSASFSEAGQSLTYKFNVEKEGYYYLAYHYRQADKTDMPVFANIVIDQQLFITDDDNAATNDALTSYAFDYTKSFQNETITDKDGKKMYQPR